MYSLLCAPANSRLVCEKNHAYSVLYFFGFFTVVLRGRCEIARSSWISRSQQEVGAGKIKPTPPGGGVVGVIMVNLIYLSKFYPRWLLGRFSRLLRSGTGLLSKKPSYFLRVTAYRYASSLRSPEVSKGFPVEKSPKAIPVFFDIASSIEKLGSFLPVSSSDKNACVIWNLLAASVCDRLCDSRHAFNASLLNAIRPHLLLCC